MMALVSPRPSLPSWREFGGLAGITTAAMLVQGYHPYVEDAEIYVPGIKQALNPALYPHNAGFFASHAHLSLFPRLIAASIRLTHVPFDWGLLCWQFAATFLLLLACWRLATLCFQDARARWGGVALVAALLTIPVAGTALYIMDQYLTARALSTPAILFVIVNVIERKFWRAGLWAVFTASVHPLMVVFGLSFAALFLWMERPQAGGKQLATVLPFFPQMTEAYREVLRSRSYFFVQYWEWYEWVGIFAPLAVFWWFARIARARQMRLLEVLCKVSIVSGFLFFVAGLITSLPASMARFAELQPMRDLHLLYILLFVFSGGLLGEFVLQNHFWRWALLFVPLCGGMTYAQFQLFPDSPHLELPWTAPRNQWVDAFLWIRRHTPIDAYFALDPDHMEMAGEDQHGFRGLAERSMLADRVKDSGAVTMFPALAETWKQQVTAQDGWKNFGEADFRKLKMEYGVDWVVVARTATGLDCPYANSLLKVCRIQ